MDRFRRQHAIIALPVGHVGEALKSDWSPGPAPFSYRDLGADSESRASYFDDRITRALYGSAARPRRWHRFVGAGNDAIPGLVVGALELSIIDFRASTSAGFLVVHGELTGDDPVASLARLARLPPLPGDDLRESYEGLADGLVQIEPGVKRLTTLAFLTPTGPLPDPFPDGYAEWTTDEKWLWILASSTPFEAYPPDVSARTELQKSLLKLSRDWHALVLRDGAGFLGLRADTGDDDPFFGAAELYFRSIYLDALLLGMTQRTVLQAIADQVAQLGDPLQSPERMRELERSATEFRNVYWWSHLSGHGAANELTRLYGDQHRLEPLANQIFSEVSEYSRQVQTAAADRTNALLGLITIVGLPIGLVIGVFQTLGIDSPFALLVVSILMLVLTIVILRAVAWSLISPLLRAARGGGTTPGED